MSLKSLSIASMLRLLPTISPRSRPPARRRPGLRPFPEALEPRLALDGSAATYTWTALGDGTSFNDPNNWSHVGPLGGGVGVTGVPSLGSNLIFPSFSFLPANSPTTINFNGSYGSYPFNEVDIGDSYNFTGNSLAVGSAIVVVNPSFGKPTDATILLSNVILGRQVAIETQQGSTLSLGDATNLTGVQLTLQGGVTKGGGGQLILDTQSITGIQSGTLQTFEVAGGTVTLGTSMDYSNFLFSVDAGSNLDVADGAAVKVGSLSGAGTVDLQGTGAAGDLTGLTVFTPVEESDRFTGSVVGAGQLALQGAGSLTLGGINLGMTGTVIVQSGTLNVDGPITAGTLQVNAGTFGGLGKWTFSGPVTFGPAATFDVTIGGVGAGVVSTELVSTDTTTGIDLGGSTLAGTVNYEYQAGDQIFVVAAPKIVGSFRDVVNDQVTLDGVPFSVSYFANLAPITYLTLSPLQSETTTQLRTSGSPSHPGQPVTFTATVSTRTQPVTSGTVSFETGGTVLGTEPVNSSGYASFTTTSLPLGSTTITAVFNGIDNILGSTSPPATQVVVPYSTVTTVTSSANPSRFRQSVTLTARVTADGMPVTAGIVTFNRGNTLIGVAALGADGTASLTTTALPRRNARIQAIYGGSTDDFGSVSPAYIQSVGRAETATVLVATRAQIGGRGRVVIGAAVNAIGLPGVNPAGTVVFRRNGRVIGRSQLAGGTAAVVLPRRARGRGRFVATFQGNPRFGASTSPLLVLPS